MSLFDTYPVTLAGERKKVLLVSTDLASYKLDILECFVDEKVRVGIGEQSLFAGNVNAEISS